MKTIFWLAAIVLLAGCNGNADRKTHYDGRLELDVVRLSAQTAGEIDSMAVDEGDPVRRGQLLARIDTRDLELQLQQQSAMLTETQANLKNVDAQETQLQARLRFNNDMVKKTRNMVQEGAATQQELDQLVTENDVLNAQLEAIRTQRAVIRSKQQQIKSAMDLIERQISKSNIMSPLDGLVLTRLRLAHEVVAPGVALLEVADPQKMEAIIYVPLEDLPQVKIGQTVKVDLQGVSGAVEGRVRQVAEEAEFTPKTILTPETRQTLVYAVTVAVNNPDGKLKAGMPVLVSLDGE